MQHGYDKCFTYTYIQQKYINREQRKYYIAKGAQWAKKEALQINRIVCFCRINNGFNNVFKFIFNTERI